MSSDLLTRLRRTVVERDTEGEEYHVPVNPDGPPAADRIEADARRIAELEGLVKEAREAAKAIRALDTREIISFPEGEGTGEMVEGECAMIAAALLARMGGSDGSA
jgi:hypothetical protein